MNQDLINYGTYEIDTITKIIDTVMNWNNRTTVVEREILNRTLYMIWDKFRITKYSINYVGQIMFYLMTVCEQHLSIHKFEKFIDAHDMLSTRH